MIEQNIDRLRDNIAAICQKCDRKPEDVTLVGVTKFASLDQIRKAIQCGLTQLGENKVQQAREKFTQLKSHTGICKRMIGHLQTNKAGQALDIFDIIDSVDSLKLAEEISRQAAKRNRIYPVLVQINTSGEEQKFGVPATKAFKLIEEIAALEHIKINGLMTIAPFTDDQETIRACFRDLKEIFDNVKVNFSRPGKVEMNDLSMGMSQDYDLAIEEGSNMIRVGSAIFKDE